MDLTRFLDPKSVSALKNLSLRADFVLRGTLAGLHRSPFHGFSSEFSQYQGYTPGDDLKHLDWKAFARSDQLVLRRFRDETNTQVYFLLDASASMAYAGSGPVSKWEYARTLAASLALLAFRQRDAVALALGGPGLASFLPPKGGASHLRDFFLLLEKAAPGESTDLSRLYAEAALRMRSGSLTFLFTDLWQEPERILHGLREIRFRNQAMTLFQILSPEEEDFLEGGDVELRDLETGGTLRVTAGLLGKAYRAALGGHRETLTRACHNLGVKFRAVSTREPYFQALRHALGPGGAWRKGSP